VPPIILLRLQGELAHCNTGAIILDVLSTYLADFDDFLFEYKMSRLSCNKASDDQKR